MEEEDSWSDWQKLSLTSEEDLVIGIEGKALEETEIEINTCLIGKLLLNRSINEEIIQSTFTQYWKLKESLKVKNIGKNLYLFRFLNEIDSIRVLETGPWSFDRGLLILERPKLLIKPSEFEFKKATFWLHILDLPLACRNKTMAEKFGNDIGEFVEVDCDESGSCWGFNLRIRVIIDITKPLRRGIKINIDGSVNGSWFPIRYERLPDYCYNCGIIGHTAKDCVKMYEQWSRNSSKKAPYGYGPRLRLQWTTRGSINQKEQGGEEGSILENSFNVDEVLKQKINPNQSLNEEPLKGPEINKETDIQEHNKDEQNTAQNLDQQFPMATTDPRIQSNPVSMGGSIQRKWKGVQI